MPSLAVILAGGQGKRLKPLTDKIPKPLAPINNIPFLDYLINSLVTVGINRILILTGYKGELIKQRYDRISGLDIKFSQTTAETKTGRRLLHAYDLLDDHFLLLYGDNYWPIELNAMWSNYNQTGAVVTTTVFSNKKGTGEYGFGNNVVVSDKNNVVKYDKKRETDTANGIDIGYFLVMKDTLDPNMPGNVSFEIDILPQFIAKKQLGAYITDTQYYYITNMQSLQDFESAAKTKNFQPLPHNYFGG